MTTEEAKELYAQFGLTAYHGQCVEIEAGTLLLTFISVDKVITSEEAMRVINSSIERQTFGALLKIIKKTVDFGESALEAVDDALKKRNYLVHHFFSLHAYDMLSPDGRIKMIEELEEIRASFQTANTLLHTATCAILKSAGVSDKDMQAAIEKEMQHVKNRDVEATP